MLKRIKLTNFKCFEELDLEFANLNVLAGINSMGKSSIIQAILLLRQSYDMDSIGRGLHLNGEVTKIGSGYDLMYRDSAEDAVSIELATEDGTYSWKYGYERDSDFLKLIEQSLDTSSLENVNAFHSNFSYVSAERIGPRSFYDKSYHKIHEMNQVGFRGELFVDYLSERGFEDRVENPLLHHDSIESSLLAHQFEGWISEVSPGLKVRPKKYMEAGIVGIGYNVAENEYTPLNIGFGISYVAPIVISLLKSKEGDLVILENPEAHLHPRGQRVMGELIARACAGGAQVIVETHSDHLLNGIRLSVKNKLIARDKIRLNYFYQDYEGNNLIHKKRSPAILDDGSLSDWPDGFFDEWDKAMDELF